MKPVEIKVSRKNGLQLMWEDKNETKVSLKKLREFCPCATCLTIREKQSTAYIPIFNDSQILVRDIQTVGSYAINIKWKDGHDTGIYEYSFLKKLSSN